MNKSLSTKKIQIKREQTTNLRSKTANQNDLSFKTQPNSKFHSLALNYFSSVSPRTRSSINNHRTKKISRISNLPTPRRISTPLSTRFASDQTRKLLEYYTNLKQNYHAFNFDVPEKLFDCEFSRQFSRFTTRFDCFSRQLACLYGTVNPKKSITNSSSMITSSLHQAAKLFTTEWIDFIERLNNISEEGISPHISMTNNNLTVLFQNLATISTIILVDKFKGDVPGYIVRSICAVCLRIKDSLVEEYSKPKSKRFLNFDYNNFEEQCRKCSQLTASLFEQNLPPNSFTLTEMLSIKSGIVTTISTISQILRSAMYFEDRIMKLKRSIISFNNELNKVEIHANLPFCIELSLDEPNEDMLGDFKSLEDEAKKESKEAEKKLSDNHYQKINDNESIEDDFFETEKTDDNEDEIQERNEGIEISNNNESKEDKEDKEKEEDNEKEDEKEKEEDKDKEEDEEKEENDKKEEDKEKEEDKNDIAGK